MTLRLHSARGERVDVGARISGHGDLPADPEECLTGDVDATTFLAPCHEQPGLGELSQVA